MKGGGTHSPLLKTAVDTEQFRKLQESEKYVIHVSGTKTFASRYRLCCGHKFGPQNLFCTVHKVKRTYFALRYRNGCSEAITDSTSKSQSSAGVIPLHLALSLCSFFGMLEWFGSSHFYRQISATLYPKFET